MAKLQFKGNTRPSPKKLHSDLADSDWPPDYGSPFDPEFDEEVRKLFHEDRPLKADDLS